MRGYSCLSRSGLATLDLTRHPSQLRCHVIQGCSWINTHTCYMFAKNSGSTMHLTTSQTLRKTTLTSTTSDGIYSPGRRKSSSTLLLCLLVEARDDDFDEEGEDIHRASQDEDDDGRRQSQRQSTRRPTTTTSLVPMLLGGLGDYSACEHGGGRTLRTPLTSSDLRATCH